MAVSKVILNGTTLMDVTQKTVTSATMLDGYTALKNDGTSITGEYVAPSFSTQSKSETYTPTTSQQTATITPDNGYDGLSSVNVTVNAMPSGSATTPNTTITANPTITVSDSGLITASVSGSQSVTPTVSAGYVSSGTSGTVSVNGSNTSQLTVYNGAHHQPTPSGYTVTVSLTNPVNGGLFSSCAIWECLSDDPYDTGNQIGSITSPTGTTTVTTTSYGISVWIRGTSVGIDVSGISCTGGVAYSNEYYEDAAAFVVTGNGTVTIDGVDYDW